MKEKKTVSFSDKVSYRVYFIPKEDKKEVPVKGDDFEDHEFSMIFDEAPDEDDLLSAEKEESTYLRMFIQNYRIPVLNTTKDSKSIDNPIPDAPFALEPNIVASEPVDLFPEDLIMPIYSI